MHPLERHWQTTTWLSLTLTPLSWVYCALVSARRWLYRRRILPSTRPPVPVIVVGNITVGGTGKTPLVLWLAEFLACQGRRPGIVARGYGGRGRAWPQAVRPDADPMEVGDEPLLLARRGNAPVVVDPKRPRGVDFLIRHYNCDVILSDDGLQHYALQRDIEIGVIDGARRFGNRRCLPAGPLRETESRLRTVDARIVQGTAQAGEWAMKLVAMGFYRLDRPGAIAPLSRFSGRRVHAVAGIAHPARFFEQLRELTLEVIEHPFPDHHPFQAKDIQFGDKLDVIMTQKDAVKCERFADARTWYLAVEAQPDARLGELVLQRLLRIKSQGDMRG